jgi:hypothetical protein
MTYQAWNHVAITRQGNTTMIFINGKLVSSKAANPYYQVSGNPLYIGQIDANIGTDFYFRGYLSELRITKGVARYTQDFSVPAAPFPNQ